MSQSKAIFTINPLTGETEESAIVEATSPQIELNKYSVTIANRASVRYVMAENAVVTSQGHLAFYINGKLVEAINTSIWGTFRKKEEGE